MKHLRLGNELATAVAVALSQNRIAQGIELFDDGAVLPSNTGLGVLMTPLFVVSVAGVVVSPPESGLPWPGTLSPDRPGLLIPLRKG